MTYLLLAGFFWLGMMVERHFVAETHTPPEPPPLPQVGDLYWNRYESLRFRIAAIYNDAVVLTEDPPDAYVRQRTGTIRDGGLDTEWVPIAGQD